MREIFIGVDPGKYGAMCIYSECGILEIIDMPLREVIGCNDDDRRREEVDSVLLHSLIIEQLHNHKIRKGEIICAHFERVGGWKRDSASSAFSFGDSAGAARTAIMIAAKPKFEIYSYPQTWKNQLNLINGGKDRSLELSTQLSPSLAPLLTQKKDHDRAEAFLLAYLACQYYANITKI